MGLAHMANYIDLKKNPTIELKIVQQLIGNLFSNEVRSLS